jgi:hypothetical protein
MTVSQGKWQWQDPVDGYLIQPHRAPVDPPVIPACMDDDELGLWQEVAAVVNNGTADPCTDCLPAFAAMMREEGRCNGIPGLGRKPSRLPDTPDRVRARIAWFRRRCVSMGIDAAHAERVG